MELPRLSRSWKALTLAIEVRRSLEEKRLCPKALPSHQPKHMVKDGKKNVRTPGRTYLISLLKQLSRLVKEWVVSQKPVSLHPFISVLVLLEVFSKYFINREFSIWLFRTPFAEAITDPEALQKYPTRIRGYDG
jgi:hypothetical protein